MITPKLETLEAFQSLQSSGKAVGTVLNDYTKAIRLAMTNSTKALMEVGRLLIGVRKDCFAADMEFKKYVEAEHRLDPSYAYRLIKAYQTYGECPEAQSVSTGVLHALMTAEDPKARLREALELQKEAKKPVTVKQARDIARKAREVIEAGDVEEYRPAPSAKELEAALDATVQTSNTKGIRRAKRTLQTMFDLLSNEMDNAAITEADMKAAVLEMLLGNEDENQTITQLRDFCNLIVNVTI